LGEESEGFAFQSEPLAVESARRTQKSGAIPLRLPALTFLLNHVPLVAEPLAFFPTSLGHDLRGLLLGADRIPQSARHVPILADACTLRITQALEHPVPVIRCVRAVAFVARAADSNATRDLLRRSEFPLARRASDCGAALAFFLITGPSFHVTRVSPKETLATTNDAVTPNRMELVSSKEASLSFSKARVPRADTGASSTDTRPSSKEEPASFEGMRASRKDTPSSM
jgi:hypothetical protein